MNQVNSILEFDFFFKSGRMKQIRNGQNFDLDLKVNIFFFLIFRMPTLDFNRHVQSDSIAPSTGARTNQLSWSHV